jgi:hypothetical protein
MCFTPADMLKRKSKEGKKRKKGGREFFVVAECLCFSLSFIFAFFFNRPRHDA